MKAIFSLAFTAALSMNTFAEDPRQAANGDHIPDVSVKAADGSEVKLREAVKSKPTVVIFYRGGWCPYCSLHLMELAKVDKDLTAAGFQILAISPDQPAKLAETPDRDKLSYALLSDSDVAAAKAFGIAFKVADEVVTKYKSEHQIDLEAASGETHHLLPHPAVFIVDKEGIIRFTHVNPDYKTRLETGEILEAAREIALPGNP